MLPVVILRSWPLILYRLRAPLNRNPDCDEKTSKHTTFGAAAVTSITFVILIVLGVMTLRGLSQLLSGWLASGGL